MFLPSFSYTPTINELLAEIAVLREKIALLAADEDSLSAMQKHNDARRAAGALALDGMAVAEQDAAAVLAGEDGLLAPEVELALRNYHAALGRAGDMVGTDEKPFGVPALMTLHFYLLYDPAARKQVRAVRRERAGLSDVRDGTPLAFAPAPADLQAGLHDLVSWLHSSRNAISPILRAALAHLRIVHLQPFATANGRVASALANVVLVGDGFAPGTLPAIEAAYAADLDRYYAAVIAAGDPESWSGEVSGWLEYSCGLLAEELRLLAIPAAEADSDAATAINERQEHILAHLAKPDAIITIEDAIDICGVAPLVAARDLRDLVEQGRIILRGQGETGYYTLRG